VRTETTRPPDCRRAQKRRGLGRKLVARAGQLVPEMERKFSGGWNDSESEVAALQELRVMELGGFEPPTSWVRCKLTKSGQLL